MISNTFANDLLKRIFSATPIANLAANAAPSPLPNLYMALFDQALGADAQAAANARPSTTNDPTT